MLLNDIPVIKRLNESLAGYPDGTLTIILLGVSLFGVAVAILGTPALKAIVAAYFVFP